MHTPPKEAAMPLKDYQESLTRLQKGMAKAYKDTPQVINVPGQSVCCKIDPNYYLALEPIFTKVAARWAVSFPDGVLDTLTHTGNVVLCRPLATHVIPLTVSWGGRDYEIHAAFVLAEFVDRALKLYAGVAEPLPVSELRIRADERAAVEAFLAGLTPPEAMAFL
jgi:hypothetical protein